MIKVMTDNKRPDIERFLKEIPKNQLHWNSPWNMAESICAYALELEKERRKDKKCIAALCEAGEWMLNVVNGVGRSGKSVVFTKMSLKLR